MKKYYRIMLGKSSQYIKDCVNGGYIGINFTIEEDLTTKLGLDRELFKKELSSIITKDLPNKSKISIGLACGALWAICKDIDNGDVVLCPDNSGIYQVGEISGDYEYKSGGLLPHRRPVRWLNKTIERSIMSESLRHSAGSIATLSNISQYREEIENLLESDHSERPVSTDHLIEDTTTFALEKHLEDFLVQNWEQTELGQRYNIFKENGELIGQQYPSDTGPIDILAISKDHKTLLVIELKKGKASDSVVGQIQRYMGFVKAELAEENQEVKGIIIALDNNTRLQRALSVTKNIAFYRYRIDFHLDEVYSYN